MVASVAELSRIPFDMPIAESELTMGYLTEYSGIRFTMFFLGEYASMIGLSAIAATLYLGGYGVPGLSGTILNFVGPGVMLTKIAILVFIIIWIRWTWPRLREDQLQKLAWHWLIPLALVNIAVVAVFKVAF
jgi:NADH-quinone oxidoreductase subunit H